MSGSTLKAKVKSSLSYPQAATILQEALREARSASLQPVSVAVLDAGGILGPLPAFE